MFAAVLLLILLQDDPAALIEQLRSDSIEERDQAARKLKALGKAAEKELRTATEDRDPEVAHTAKYLLRFLDFQDRLPPAIQKTFPGAADRLARGDDHEATTLLFEASRVQSLTTHDLQALAPLAVRGVKTEAEMLGLLDLITTWKLTSAAVPILDWFASSNESVRDAAVDAIVQLRPKGMLDPLRGRLRSEVASERACAALTLGRLHLADAGRDLLALLDDPERDVRLAAMRGLGSLKEPGAVAPLRALLAHGDAGVRAEAVQALESFGDAAPILPLLHDADWGVRVAAIGAVCSLRERKAIPDLRAALRDPQKEVVDAAIESLVTFEAKESVPDLVALLPLAAAMRALGDLGARESGPAVLRVLDHPDSELRATAIQTLATLQHLEAIPRIVRMMKEDPGEDVRFVAEEALGSFRGKEALPAFRALLEDPNSTVRIAALGALAEISGTDSAKMILELLHDPELEVRRTALSILDDLGYREAVPEIVKLFEDPDLGADAIRAAARFGAAVPAAYLDHERAEVRAAAVYALARLEAREHVPEIVARLADPDASVRLEAIQALQDLRAREHAPAIALLLDDEEARVQTRAVYALAEFRVPEALPALRKRMKNEDGRIRLEVLQKLTKFREAIPDLIEALADSSPSVREEALRGLAGYRVREALPKIVALLPDLDAIDAVGSLGTKDDLRHLEPLLRNADADVRSATLRAVARIGCPLDSIVKALDDPLAQVVIEAIDALADRGTKDRIAEFLRHREPRVRCAAARALAWLDAREETAEVRKLLADADASVRGAAAEALGDLGAMEADLRPLLQDKDDSVRACAAFGLAYLGATGAAGEILKLASDPRRPDWVRTNAIWAVTKLGAKDAVPALRDLLHDPDSALRWECAWSLAQLGDRESMPDFRALLAERNGDVRASASSALARLGSREGVETLMRAADQGIVVILEDLNQLRRPGESDRLRGRRLSRDLAGSLEEIWAAIGKESGLTVERPDDPEFRRARARVRTFGGTATLYDAMADTSGYGYEFILETDRVRVVSREAALAFWKSWAAKKGD